MGNLSPPHREADKPVPKVRGHRSKNKGKRRRFYFLLLFAGYVLVLLEGGARGYLKYTMGASFWHPDQVIWRFYRELKPLEKTPLNRDDEIFDVLLLGGSVLHPRWGAVDSRLRSELAKRVGGNVHVHNLAKAAHTSLDSLYKYQKLEDKHFELVLFYHGINETRANNCPADFFRSNYAHYLWYRKLNTIVQHGELPFMALPFFVHTLSYDLRDEFVRTPYLWVREVRSDWIHYGSDVKTAASFRSNVHEILEIAKRKREQVVLMTFAYYVVADYSREKFEDHALDYSQHRIPIEAWGKPSNVVSGIVAHNNALRELAQQHGTPVIDQKAFMPTGARYFDDICHLTDAGSERFVEPIVDWLLKQQGEGP